MGYYFIRYVPIQHLKMLEKLYIKSIYFIVLLNKYSSLYVLYMILILF